MSEPADKTVSGPAPSNGRFLLWSLLLIAMIGAVFYSFSLLSDLMGELVGGKAVVFGASVASVAAGLIVALEVFMGLFFLESRGKTAMFPVIHELEPVARKSLQVFTIFLLSMFALIEAGLVWMAFLLPLRHSAAGATELPIYVSAKMAVAFVLPFILILAGLSADRVLRMLRGQQA